MKILKITPEWLADSELGKTIQVRIFTDKGIFSGSAPQGTSIGKHEAVSIDVGKAIANIKRITPKIMKFKPSYLERLDKYLSEIGGEQFKHFGGNSSIALGSAWVKMAAASEGLEIYEYFAELLKTKPKIPVPCFNVINGGAHGALDSQGRPYNPIQEIMLVPVSKTFEQGYERVMKVFQSLKKVSHETLVGKEGGISPKLSLQESIELLERAIKEAGFSTKDFRLAIDAASSEFYDAKTRAYSPETGNKTRKSGEMIDFYRALIKKSPIKIYSIEDPFQENDFDSFAILQKELSNVVLIGDDLYVTNLERLKKGVQKKATKGILIKVNQNGTVSGTLEVIRQALASGMINMISHRSKRVPGEFIDAHLAIATGQLIKYGSSKGERVEVYNKILEIERDKKLPYAGKEILD